MITNYFVYGLNIYIVLTLIANIKKLMQYAFLYNLFYILFY